MVQTESRNMSKEEIGMTETLEGQLVTAEEAAKKGHVAVDAYGHAIIAFDPAEEARLRRKMDRRILPFTALIYLFCFIDRANIGNARIAGLEKDLHITGYGYNILLTAFYAPYVAAELPCNLVCKKLGPGKFLPALTVLFGLFSMCTAFCHTFGATIAMRALLGVAESGIFPGLAYYMSRWYRKEEMIFRMATYVMCTPIAGAFGGLLASGILKIDHIGWLTRWRMIFLIEGLLTMLVGVGTWFVLVDGPENAKWLSPHEKALAIARLKSENVGAVDHVDKISWTQIKEGLSTPTSVICALIFLLINITVQGVGFFLPTIIRSLYPGLSTVQQQLRTVPPYVIGIAATLFFPYISFKTKRRALFMTISSIPIIVGYAMFLSSTQVKVRYAAVFIVLLGPFQFGVYCNAWASANTTSDTARAMAIGLTAMGGNMGGLIATWTYLPTQAPRYVPGTALNLATAILVLVCTVSLWVWQLAENKKKEQASKAEYTSEETLAHADMLGTAHPGFRFRT